jgi:hypothetical protein
MTCDRACLRIESAASEGLRQSPQFEPRYRRLTTLDGMNVQRSIHVGVLVVDIKDDAG